MTPQATLKTTPPTTQPTVQPKPLQVLHRDDLPEGGFAGLREHRLVVAPRVFGSQPPGSWRGLDKFVYLADARFMPRGETHMHQHRGIDVISIVVEGRIAHDGSLGQGEELSAFAVQVQRSGSVGFAHNEINPDATWNRMIQIWALPPSRSGSDAGYKVYRPEPATVTRVYGGAPDQTETFDSSTLIDVARLGVGETFSVDGEFIAYLTKGHGNATGHDVADGDLLRGDALQFEAGAETQLIVIRAEN